MKAIRDLSVAVAVSLSCALAGCTVPVPEEGEVDPTLDESTGDESGMSEDAAAEEDTAEASSEIQSAPANAMGCHDNGRYCLARCNATGNTQFVVGHLAYLEAQGTNCVAASENFCRSTGRGFRTHLCRGYVQP